MRALKLTLFLLLLTASYPAYGTSIPLGKKAQGYAQSIAFKDMPTCLVTTIFPPPTTCSACMPDPGFMPPPLVTFDGMSRGASCRRADLEAAGVDAASWPSDDSGAIGPHHYMQSVNLALSVYDRAGKLIYGPVRTNTFWSALSTNPQLWDPAEGTMESCNDRTHTDAVVDYDRQADRWVVSRPGGAPTGRLLCIAVSETPDPTGKYDQFAFLVNSISLNVGNPFDFSTFFNDYPKLAIWPDAYYATANPDHIFSGRGNTITAFDRSAMLSGDHQPGYVTFFVEAPQVENPNFKAHSHMLPADLDGDTLPPSGTPEYVVQVQDSNLGYPAGRLQVYEFHVDWSKPSNSTFTPTTTLTPDTFNSNACPQQSCIPQPSAILNQPPPSLDSVSYGYMMYRLSYRNFGDHQMLLFNHTVAADGDPSNNRAGIRWYELRRAGGPPWAIYQQGTYAPSEQPPNDRWLGSIAMDSGSNIALGFDIGSPSVFPSIHYAGRLVSDPLNELSLKETTLVNGNGVQTGIPTDNDSKGNPITNIFFGDYSQMTIDPTDDCTFWYTNTYYLRTTTPDDWHTRIGAFRFPNCFEFFTLVPVVGINAGAGQFQLTASLHLKDQTNGINPLTQDVTLQLGSFSVTIPAGSFKRQRRDRDDEVTTFRNRHDDDDDDVVYKFEGTIGTVRLHAEITRDDNTFRFQARGRGATNLPTANPVIVVLTIGHDRGTATATADFESHRRAN